MLELSSCDADKLRLYKEAQDLIKGLPGNSYPDRELQWLVTTCWNRGAHQAKFMRFEMASQYMRLAMELLQHCGSLTNRQEVKQHIVVQCPRIEMMMLAGHQTTAIA